MGTGLNLDFGHLPWAESNVGKYLSRGGTSQPDGTLVFFCGLFTSQVHVVIFENFVETVFEGTLHRVTDERGSEAFPDSPGALLGSDRAKRRKSTLVLGWVYLQRRVRDLSKSKYQTTNLGIALGNIERGASSVGGSTGKDTAEHALGIVGSIVGNGAEKSASVSEKCAFSQLNKLPSVPFTNWCQVGHTE